MPDALNAGLNDGCFAPGQKPESRKPKPAKRIKTLAAKIQDNILLINAI
jgi:hypothetical protein